MRQIGDRVLVHLDGPTDEIGQVLAVLEATGVAEPGNVTVGAGDRILLDVVGQLTGSFPELTVACPDCDELNSIVISPDRLPAAILASAWCGPGGGLRQPTYADLQALAPLLDEGRTDDASQELLRRCTVGEPPSPPTADDLDRVDDALTGPSLVTCYTCGLTLEADVDVERITLEALCARARQVEYELHLLARAYRWDLATIEALSDPRRRRLALLVAEGR